MSKTKLSRHLIAGVMAIVGLGVGIATMASAQSAVTTATPASTKEVTSTTVDTPEAGDVADVPDVAESKTQGHAPLGGDGVVSNINGTTIIIGEESNEGGSSYVVDASKAAVTNNGVTGTLSDIKIGAKIFVQGVINGTNISATSIFLGKHGEGVGKANDTDGGSATEASEPATAPDTSDQ